MMYDKISLEISVECEAYVRDRLAEIAELFGQKA
jgi:hypothetical protein